MLYSADKVQALLGISPGAIRAMVKAGFVMPTQGSRRAPKFTFQDLMLLRTAWALQEASISPRKIIAALAKIKANLPQELPLTGLRITAVGSDVAVHSPSGSWAAESGQRLIDFEVTAVGGEVTFLEPAFQNYSLDRVETLLALGQALESSEPDQAEALYREALASVPNQVDAYLNLGALLCTVDRCKEAAALYEQALSSHPNNGLLLFNYALALEDLDRPADAVRRYEQCLKVDPSLIDAHYNAGMVLQKLGDGRGALRHLSAYSRLSK